MAAQKREACNFPVQNLVADYVSRAVINFSNAKQWSECPFRLKLSVHDSIVLSCKAKDVPYICDEVVKKAFGIANPVPLLNFHFGIESEVTTRLACKASREELESLGVPAGYVPTDLEAAIVASPENPYRSQMAALKSVLDRS